MSKIYSFLFLTTGGKVLLLVVLAAIAGYIFYRRWKKAGAYVSSVQKAHGQWLAELKDYTRRAMEHPRWSEFWNKMNQQCRVSIEKSSDPEIYELFYVNVIDDNGNQLEPESSSNRKVTLVAFLQKAKKPYYLQFEFRPSGEMIKREISTGDWNEMFAERYA